MKKIIIQWINIEEPKRIEYMQWLASHIGPAGKKHWWVNNHRGKKEFVFYRDEDALAFKMKFSWTIK